MGKYIKYYDTHSEYDEEKDLLELPNVSWCEQEEDVHYTDENYYSKQYLTFIALEDGTFKFLDNSINYSLDNGITWTALASNTNSPTITTGNKIMWKASGLTININRGIGIFSSTGKFNIQGNIMSLVEGDNFDGALTISNYQFASLFYQCNNLISAKNLVLPSITLTQGCYNGMFYECTKLTTAPDLPATTLARACYWQMFYRCYDLVKVPLILPATTLARDCYHGMFISCKSLTTAPELPATSLETYCYESMFNSCTNLNYIKAMFTTTPGSSCTSSWLYNVAASGTFIKNSAATWTTTGANGIPSGWTVITADS